VQESKTRVRIWPIATDRAIRRHVRKLRLERTLLVRSSLVRLKGWLNCVAINLQECRCRFSAAPERKDLIRNSLIQFWWARQNSNLQPDRHERSALPKNSSIFNGSCARSCTFVLVCLRGFCGISGGRQPPDQPESGMAQKARKSAVESTKSVRAGRRR
jgi:hypothetical protein